jgi:hypothetical protein
MRSAMRSIDVDDVGTHIRQHHAGERRGTHVGRLDNSHAGERAVGHVFPFDHW